MSVVARTHAAAPDAAAIVDADALTLSAWIHARSVSCREVMQAYLAHIAEVNPAVNAIVAMRDEAELLREADACDAELAQGRSRGWMHGMPQAPKDLAAVRGMVTTQGSPLFARNVPTQDAYAIARLRGAGGIFVGRTNTPEFGLGSQSYNPVYGVTGNAYDPALTGGGSSGGAAVALALRMLPVADGSDMMGSLRNPAGFNNVFGFRPSAGLVPGGPTPELFLQGLSTDGPMARNVPDLAMLLATQAGREPRSPLSLDSDPEQFMQVMSADAGAPRIGWLGDLDGYLATEAGVLDVCEGAMRVLQGIGCQVEAATLGFAPERLWQTWRTLRSFLVGGKLGPHYAKPASRALLKPEAQWEVEQGLGLPASDVYAAYVERSAWYTHLLGLFERYDFLALPTAQVFAFDKHVPWPKEIAGRAMDTYHRWMEVVIPATLAGVPAISVPAGFDARGRAMGVQLIGKPQDDLGVLRLAHAYDMATGWTRVALPSPLPRAAQAA